MSVEESQDWIFTFGWGQHDGTMRRKFVRIYGTFSEARDEMMRRYGRQWSMQYCSEEDAGVARFQLEEVR